MPQGQIFKKGDEKVLARVSRSFCEKISFLRLLGYKLCLLKGMHELARKNKG